MAEATKRLKSIIGGSAGNFVEWYDWFAYASLSIYFAPAFFPEDNETIQLMNTAAIFAVGFIMRPIGAWVMGIYGDRHGRKAGLALSVGLMCAGSLLIAIAPTYATAGWAAPALLVFARMLQGLSVGGEFGASSTYLSEMATRERRGFWSSFHYVTLIGGQLAALGVLLVLQMLLSETALEAWGWRIPFAIGAALAAGVYLFRRGLAETAQFAAIDRSATPPSSARHLWAGHRRATLMIVAMTIGGTLAFYAYTTYLQKFLVNTSGFTRPQATAITAAALAVFMLQQPFWGWLSDQFGRKPQMIFFGLTGMLATVPVFHALATTSDALIAFALAVIPMTLMSAYTSVGPITKAELYPAHIRTLGVALPYAIANTAFGGTAEYVALWLKNAGMEAAFYWYVSAGIAVALAAFIALPDTKRISQISDD
ncbi:MFS transporter, MHS family, alpha-ketoglutarate permease [Sphingomonas laterariae]|uniref:MFS transporter, MHS family, alpha-ketoglutarate permease n=1 Tax=Edaphosphingomonas laterariae TaxID=861865 RepID=A0A239F505_9SPHN|nr:MFS transporter [Sphingomonas laterariae]SNS51986.1 MFS transporter, MHS family, alpha-ketoglutarate permease [Sphingomonas laterariae]